MEASTSIQIDGRSGHNDPAPKMGEGLDPERWDGDPLQ
jgi:hypothetical protein